jgi:hypothetical protein
MVRMLLQLSQLSFHQNGSIEEVNGKWEVTDRLLAFNMNELVQMANFLPQKLPSTTFYSSSDYFRALTDTHLTHLSTQHNDTIDSVEDCRSGYVARLLLRKLAYESCLETEIRTKMASYLTRNTLDLYPKPFKLFCDDFRPSNVLLDAECNVVAVIDCEFKYATPVEYNIQPTLMAY